MISPSTERKRQQLVDYIERQLKRYDAVRAVVGIGSIGAGTAREDSDIDAAVFLEPFDPYLVPEIPQFDFQRYDLQQWRAPGHDWPEPIRAELAAGWIAFDRDGEVSRLIAERTAYDDAHRLAQLDEAFNRQS